MEDGGGRVSHDRLIAEYDRLSSSMKETFTFLFQINMQLCLELANNNEEFSSWFSELNKVINLYCHLLGDIKSMSKDQTTVWARVPCGTHLGVKYLTHNSGKVFVA